MKRIYLILFFLPSLANAQWSAMGTGANGLFAFDYIFHLLSDNTGNVYATPDISNASGHSYVAKWTGTNWVELGTGANSIDCYQGYEPILATDPTGNIYAAGSCKDNVTGKYYVQKWNGVSWSKLGSGANGLNANGEIEALATDLAGNVYVSGWFKNASGKNYVAKWNGTSWSELGTGANSLNANDHIMTLAIDNIGNVYAGGRFTQPGGDAYVAKWNGTTWSAVGATTYHGLEISLLATDINNNVYASGVPSTGQGYDIVMFNGTAWTVLGGTTANLNPCCPVYDIKSDNWGNIYAGGYFKFPSTNKYCVAQWNGVQWNDLGNSTNQNFNGAIFALAVDNQTNVYAAGGFKNSSNKAYVAKFTAPVGIHENRESNFELFPIPAEDRIYLRTKINFTGTIILRDALGNKITEVVEENLTSRIFELKELSPGFYYIQLTSNKHETITLKLIKS
ncbi:MAG: T9SS type A sorting domain-containing protein [Bacteroidetes bacterium]|nr:T9SS type A sorting domain-containing protein [Bacteroidota bacterium]